MNTVVQFRSRGRVRQEASEWLARMDRGLSAPERERLGLWLVEKAAHRRVLIEMATLWDDMEAIAELSVLFPLDRYASRRHRVRRMTGWLSAAVCVVVATAAWIGYSRFGSDPGSAAHTVADSLYENSYATAVGEQRRVDLPDGSRITLNTDTRITVRYTESQRMIGLERGEGYFQVAHDAGRAFDVRAGQRVVQAVGTAFNVRLAEDQLDVTVTEGRVKLIRATLPTVGGVSGTAAESLLVAGQSARLERDTDSIRALDAAALDTQLAWQRGMLIFSGEPLEVALTEFGRYTSIRFVLADPAMGTIRVGGYFRVGDVDGLLVALKENFQIDARHAASDEIILSDRQPR